MADRGAIAIKLDNISHFTLVYCKKDKNSILELTKQFIQKNYNSDSNSNKFNLNLRIGDKWGRNSWFVVGDFDLLKKNLYNYLCENNFKDSIDDRQSHIDFKGNVDWMNKWNNSNIEISINDL